MSGIQRVLDYDASVLGYPEEISAPLDTDHKGICKFGSRNDPSYVAVRNAITIAITKIIDQRMIVNPLPQMVR